jgi:hypothetical protein
MYFRGSHLKNYYILSLPYYTLYLCLLRLTFRPRGKQSLSVGVFSSSHYFDICPHFQHSGRYECKNSVPIPL